MEGALRLLALLRRLLAGKAALHAGGHPRGKRVGQREVGGAQQAGRQQLGAVVCTGRLLGRVKGAQVDAAVGKRV